MIKPPVVGEIVFIPAALSKLGLKGRDDLPNHLKSPVAKIIKSGSMLEKASNLGIDIAMHPPASAPRLITHKDIC